MPLPNVDTFEHDISEEIKTKEATIGDIASAGGDVGNIPVRTSSLPTLLIVLGIVLFIAVIAIAILFFIRFSNTPVTVPSSGNSVQSASPSGMQMSAVSYDIDQAVGASLGTVHKSEYGYTIDIVSYSDVFAYMLKNESKFADELAVAVGSPRDTSTTTTPFSFTDTTINNQNMRVGASASSTVVYAFVNMKTLLISSTTEGILALRGAILR